MAVEKTTVFYQTYEGDSLTLTTLEARQVFSGDSGAL